MEDPGAQVGLLRTFVMRTPEISADKKSEFVELLLQVDLAANLTAIAMQWHSEIDLI